MLVIKKIKYSVNYFKYKSEFKQLKEEQKKLTSDLLSIIKKYGSLYFENFEENLVIKYNMHN